MPPPGYRFKLDERIGDCALIENGARQSYRQHPHPDSAIFGLSWVENNEAT